MTPDPDPVGSLPCRWCLGTDGLRLWVDDVVLHPGACVDSWRQGARSAKTRQPEEPPSQPDGIKRHLMGNWGGRPRTKRSR